MYSHTTVAGKPHHHFVLQSLPFEASRISVPIYTCDSQPHDTKVVKIRFRGKEHLHTMGFRLHYMLMIRLFYPDSVYERVPQNQVNNLRNSHNSIAMWLSPRNMHLGPWPGAAEKMTEQERYAKYAFDMNNVYDIRIKMKPGCRLILELQNLGDPLTIDMNVTLHLQQC